MAEQLALAEVCAEVASAPEYVVPVLSLYLQALLYRDPKATSRRVPQISRRKIKQ